ncbi:hypothetical protein T439DRAFT_328090 [Meredithblackwellia eburnea MCA 4105]
MAGTADEIHESYPPPPPSSAPHATASAGADQQEEQQGLTKQKPTMAAGLRRRVLHFTPSWFSVTMGTGIVAILLHNLPYRFPGSDQLAIAVFILNIALFCSFSLASAARYILWPKVFWTMLYHPQQSLFLGTVSMGFATLVNLTVLIGVPAFGPHFAQFAWSLWWVDVALSLLISIGVPIILFTQHEQELKSINAVWLLPIVAPNVAAASGGLVATVLPDTEARVTIIVSYLLWASMPVATIIMTLVFLRMAIYKVPPAEAVVSLFLPVGACGQGAYGLLQIAAATRSLTERSGAWLAAAGLDADRAVAVADAVWGVSICTSLIIWAFGWFWLLVALYVIIDMSFQRKVPFNMGWWGLTFPIGAHATATVTFAKQLGSTTFEMVGMIQSCVVCFLWLYIASMTAIRAWEGSIFVAPCLGSTGEPPKEAPKKKQY